MINWSSDFNSVHSAESHGILRCAVSRQSMNMGKGREKAIKRGREEGGQRKKRGTGRERRGEGGKKGGRVFFHSLVTSNAHNNQGRNRPKPGAHNPIQVSHGGGRGLSISAINWCLCLLECMSRNLDQQQRR